MTVAPVEMPASVIDALIDRGWLAEDEAGDPHCLGEAVLKAAKERLRQGF